MMKSKAQPARFVIGQQIGLLLIAGAVWFVQGRPGPAWLWVLFAVWQGLLVWQYYRIYRSTGQG
ncbi:hypothetical protein AB0O52_12425 [Arthrobacter sp. NPDC080073]|uniref:hypothetical protein n=1 Tax=Arthrobacter sp. NPDC080073 TaxID=3155919 RepID=UPI00341C4830